MPCLRGRQTRPCGGMQPDRGKYAYQQQSDPYATCCSPASPAPLTAQRQRAPCALDKPLLGVGHPKHSIAVSGPVNQPLSPRSARCDHTFLASRWVRGTQESVRSLIWSNAFISTGLRVARVDLTRSAASLHFSAATHRAPAWHKMLAIMSAACLQSVRSCPALASPGP